MNYKIIWTQRAVKNLQAIYDYIFEDSPFQAQRVTDSIIDCVEPLMTFPNMGVKVQEVPEDNLRELVKFSYRIIYRVVGEETQILTVLHSRQDFKVTFYTH